MTQSTAPWEADLPTKESFDELTTLGELLTDAVAFGAALLLSDKIVGTPMSNGAEVTEEYLRLAELRARELTCSGD